MVTSNYKSLSKQKGVALITILFLFALATVIISGLVTLLQINTQRASSVLESEQAYLLTLSGEEWARQILAEDYKTNHEIDHVHEPWAEDGKIIELDNGYIEVSIKDAQGKFNINNLSNGSAVNSGAKIAFQRLIDFGLQDKLLSTAIAEEATDWLDSDSSGIEATDYMSASIPYRPPNSMITDVSELRWLKSVDQKSYRILHQEAIPFLIALPKQTLVNINTVSAPVLAALSGLSIPEAESIVISIQGDVNGHNSVASATNAPQVLAAGQSFGVYTEYFEVRVRARFADHYAFLTSIIFRDHQNNGKITIVSRDRSERFIFPFSKDYNRNGKSKDYDINI